MIKFRSLSWAILPLVALLGGCSSDPPPAAVAPSAAMAGPAPIPVLKTSLYAKDSTGGLSEEDLQKVLSSRIDLAFPARVGVVPLSAAFESGGRVSMETRTAASGQLSVALRGHANFSQVSDISTELPNTGGIEGLRVLAARYRLRYLLLYTERFEDQAHLNAWALTYPTLVGVFAAPGVTLESRGFAEVDLLDVRTGSVLFSVVEPLSVSEKDWAVGSGRTHAELKARAAAEGAKRLAKKVFAQTNALVAFADEAARPDQRLTKRFIPAPVVVE